jgi:cytochrome c-type biogenesis protein CcmH
MKTALLMLLTTLASAALAAIDAYQFADPAQEQQFRELTAELRCPKCQNQNIADSNAPLAQDLRQRVYEMTRQGRAKQDIVDFMVARYGDFVTYRPPMRPLTWVLWFGPFAAIGCAALLLGVWLRGRRPRAQPELSAHDRERLRHLLSGTPGDR